MDQSDKNKIRAGYKSRNLIKTSDLSDQLGKLPPQAVDIEQAILGAVMIEKNALLLVSDVLQAHHFYKDSHQEVYSAIIELAKKSEPIDILTVTNQLRKNGKLEFIGGAYYISELTSKVSSAANIEFHARIIIEKAIKRVFIEFASEIHKEAYEDTTDVFDLMEKFESRMLAIHGETTQKELQPIGPIANDYFNKLITLNDEKKELTGVPCGFINIDSKTAGWQKSDLILIAARPGMGKTTLAVNFCRNAAIDFKKPCAIFSLEMSAQQLVKKCFSIESEVNIKEGKLQPFELDRIADKIMVFDDAPIYIDDTGGLTVFEIKSKIKRLMMLVDIQIIVIDYIQLMKASSGKKYQNREAEVSDISRELKAVAKELNVPIIAISQLSRACETRAGDKRPQLSDLRESGSLEQDADIVIFVYRPEYYKIMVDENGKSTIGLAEIIFAKFRNGVVGTRILKWLPAYQKFKQEMQTEIEFKRESRDYSEPSYDQEDNNPPF